MLAIKELMVHGVVEEIKVKKCVSRQANVGNFVGRRKLKFILVVGKTDAGRLLR